MPYPDHVCLKCGNYFYVSKGCEHCRAEFYSKQDEARSLSEALKILKPDHITIPSGCAPCANPLAFHDSPHTCKKPMAPDKAYAHDCPATKFCKECYPVRPTEITKDNLRVGDVIECTLEEMDFKVLEKLENSFLASISLEDEGAEDWFTFAQARKMGWRIKLPPSSPREVTMDEVRAVMGDVRIKD